MSPSGHSCCLPALAAGQLSSAAGGHAAPLPATPTSPSKTRVGGWPAHPSGRSSRRGPRNHWIAPGCRGGAAKIASDRSSWPNRDPIGDLGVAISKDHRKQVGSSSTPNLYGFTKNNPVAFVDMLGLSEADVSRILDQFRKTLKTMCGEKIRCDCRPFWMRDVHAFFSPTVSGCGYQADYMQGEIIGIMHEFDDPWTTEHVVEELVMSPSWLPVQHQYVKVAPTKPSGDVDYITLDTFYGCYEVLHSRLVHMPNPLESFRLYTREKKCFTCKDL